MAAMVILIILKTMIANATLIIIIMNNLKMAISLLLLPLYIFSFFSYSFSLVFYLFLCSLCISPIPYLFPLVCVIFILSCSFPCPY